MNSEDSTNGLYEKLNAILSQRTTKRNKILNLMQFIAETQRDAFYKIIDVEKSHGPAFVEKVKKSAIFGGENGKEANQDIEMEVGEKD